MEPEDDTEKCPVFENDGASSTDRAPTVTTRINRRRAGSLKSIRKRLSVQRRSTIGLGDNRNFSDDSEDLQNEVITRKTGVTSDASLRMFLKNKAISLS